MRALRCSPEFVRRQQAILEHELAEEEAQVPQLLEDDLGQHLHEHEPVDEHDHPINLIQTLMAYGVERREAYNAVGRLVMNMTPCTFHGIYGRGAIVNEANAARRDMNIKGLRTFDLRVVRDDGMHWDLTIAKHRAEAFKIIQ